MFTLKIETDELSHVRAAVATYIRTQREIARTSSIAHAHTRNADAAQRVFEKILRIERD